MAYLVLFGCSCWDTTSILGLVWKAKFSQLAALTFLNSKYVTRHNMLYFIFEPCQKYGEETTFILSWMEMKNIIENKKKVYWMEFNKVALPWNLIRLWYSSKGNYKSEFIISRTIEHPGIWNQIFPFKGHLNLKNFVWGE